MLYLNEAHPHCGFLLTALLMLNSVISTTIQVHVCFFCKMFLQGSPHKWAAWFKDFLQCKNTRKVRRSRMLRTDTVSASWTGWNEKQNYTSNASFGAVCEEISKIYLKLKVMLWWVDPGWLSGTHQSHLITPLHCWTVERRYNESFMCWDEDRER